MQPHHTFGDEQINMYCTCGIKVFPLFNGGPPERIVGAFCIQDDAQENLMIKYHWLLINDRRREREPLEPPWLTSRSSAWPEGARAGALIRNLTRVFSGVG